jgi:hypothetical protein
MSLARMTRGRRSTDAESQDFGLNGYMNKLRSMSLVILGAMSALALAGCAAIGDTLQNESSIEFDTAAEVADEWEDTAPWLPDDATRIQIHQSVGGGPAILLSTSEGELDPSLCVETERKSAATFTQDWSPESYVDTVFACGDWAVIPTETGWYGWTPNHPDERAASLRVSSE